MIRLQKQQQQNSNRLVTILCCLLCFWNLDNTNTIVLVYGAPINDNICDATILSIDNNDNDSTQPMKFDLTDATIETNEIENVFTISNSVWYKFVTPSKEEQQGDSVSGGCITIFTSSGLDDDDDTSSSSSSNDIIIDPHMALYEVVGDDDDCTTSTSSTTIYNNLILIEEDDDDGKHHNALLRAQIKPSTTYYLQIDPYTTNDNIIGYVTAYTCHNNDDACNAYQLDILDLDFDDDNTTATQPTRFDLYWGTVEIGEVNPGSGSIAISDGDNTTTSSSSSSSDNDDNDDGCTAKDGWCTFETEVDNTLWYKVIGPDTGCISITTTGGDTQLALWSVDTDDNDNDVECGNFTGFHIVAANDDQKGSCNGGLFDSSCEAILTDVEVIVGKLYYIQLDGHNGLDVIGTIHVTDCSIPTQSPTTPEPTQSPTPEPTQSPTPGPSMMPSSSNRPSLRPTVSISPSISVSPSDMPSTNPSISTQPSIEPTIQPTPAPTTPPTSPPMPKCDCNGWPLGPKRRSATTDPTKGGCVGFIDCEIFVEKGTPNYYKECPNDTRFDVKNQLCNFHWAFVCEEDITCAIDFGT